MSTPPSTPLSDDHKRFLAEANPSVIGTTRPDGQPVTVPTWYLLDGERILVNMDATRKRIAYLRDDPRVSLTVLAADGWHSHLSMRGRIVEWAEDEDLSDIDRLAQHYGLDRYPDREGKRVSAWIEVDQRHSWGPRFA